MAGLQFPETTVPPAPSADRGWHKRRRPCMSSRGLRGSTLAGLRCAARAGGSGASRRWLRLLGTLFVGDFTAHDLAVEWEGLKHDVEALAVLVFKHEAKVEPKVVLAFASDHRIG